MKKIKFSGKSNGVVFKNGAMASALTAFVLAAVVLVNLIAAKLPSKYTKFDLTQNGLYSIGDSTKELLAGLKQDVTFYYLAQTGNENQNLVAFMNRYADESRHVSWQQKDPALYPT